MLDTHAVARSLTDAEFTPAQADAITNAVRLAAEHGNHVTTDQFEAGLAKLRAELRQEIADLRQDVAGVRSDAAEREARIIRWMVGVALAVAGVGIALLRLWPPAAG